MTSPTHHFGATSAPAIIVRMADDLPGQLHYSPDRIGPQFYESTTEQDLMRVQQQLIRSFRQRVGHDINPQNLPKKIVVSIRPPEPLGYETDILIPQGQELIDARTNKTVRLDASTSVAMSAVTFKDFGLDYVDLRQHAGLSGVKSRQDFPAAAYVVGVFYLEQLNDAEDDESPRAEDDATENTPTYVLSKMFPSAHPQAIFDPLQEEVSPQAVFHSQAKPEGPTSTFRQSGKPLFLRLALIEHLEKIKTAQSKKPNLANIYVPIYRPPRNATFRQRTAQPALAPSLTPITTA